MKLTLILSSLFFLGLTSLEAQETCHPYIARLVKASCGSASHLNARACQNLPASYQKRMAKMIDRKLPCFEKDLFKDPASLQNSEKACLFSLGEVIRATQKDLYSHFSTLVKTGCDQGKWNQELTRIHLETQEFRSLCQFEGKTQVKGETCEGQIRCPHLEVQQLESGGSVILPLGKAQSTLKTLKCPVNQGQCPTVALECLENSQDLLSNVEQGRNQGHNNK